MMALMKLVKQKRHELQHFLTATMSSMIVNVENSLIYHFAVLFNSSLTRFYGFYLFLSVEFHFFQMQSFVRN